MRWLHISDIHYNPNTAGRITTKLCEKLPDYIQQLNVKVDEVFVTGDFCSDYNENPDLIATKAVEFVCELAAKVGINDPNHIHIVPGNHDITRFENESEEQRRFDKIREGYNVDNGRFSHDDMTFLLKRFSFFYSISNKLHPINSVWTNSFESLHKYRCFGDYSLLYINTAILYGDSKDRNNLSIGNFDLNMALKAIRDENPNTPIIALAHHSLDFLSVGERRVVQELFTEYGVNLYLCGDEHKSGCYPHHKTIEIVMGCIEGSVDGTQATFTIGEMQLSDDCYSLKSHRWNGRNWEPYLQFEQDFDDSLLQQIQVRKNVKRIYYEYLKNEYIYTLSGSGFIDNEVLLKTTALEKLFIPTRFIPHRYNLNHSKSNMPDDSQKFNLQFGNKFNDYPIPKEGCFRIVVFSGPGGGKTTWMKKLLSAFAHKNFDDFGNIFPRRDLFPIWIKCRDFKEDTQPNIFEIIEKISERLCFDEIFKQAFIELTNLHIRKGTGVILIDGIDEITIDLKRQEFIEHLKKFTDDNKNVNIIMSSRRVGAENIKKDLSSNFRYWNIQEFSEQEIKMFCNGWYKIFSKDTEKAIETALKLSDTMIKDNKIFQLAKKPVLLEMLLLISKKNGDRLPARRVEIYEEAIKMLLEKWNPDGFPKIELRDALPLMAYLAHHMVFSNGIQRTIDKAELITVLDSAQKEMQQYKLSEETLQFVDRVEKRSELFVRRNINQLNGVYEFQHPTFQDYLAAVSITLKKYPNARHRKSISDCFNNHWEISAMQEVIIFTVTYTDDIDYVQEIIQSIFNKLSEVRSHRCVDYQNRINYLVDLLLGIIASEAALTPADCNKILLTCFESGISSSVIGENFLLVCESKRYKEIVYETFAQIDNKRFTPFFSSYFELNLLQQTSNFSILHYYFDEKKKGNVFDVINLLQIETFLKWKSAFPNDKQSLKIFLDFKNIKNLNTFFEDLEILKTDLYNFCMGSDMKLGKISFQVLYRLYKDEDDVFSTVLLQALIKIFDDWPPIAIYVSKFPINKNTILFLHGFSMSESQQLILQEKMIQEMDPFDLLQYFIFGILCCTWDTKFIIETAIKLHHEKCVDLRTLYNKLKKYFSVLQKEDLLEDETKILVEDYLSQYKIEITHVNELYTWNNIERLLKGQGETENFTNIKGESKNE